MLPGYMGLGGQEGKSVQGISPRGREGFALWGRDVSLSLSAVREIFNKRMVIEARNCSPALFEMLLMVTSKNFHYKVDP